MGNPFALLQAQLAGWRPSVYNFQNIEPTYNLLPRHTMATHHHKDGETTWTLHTSEHDEKPQYLAQSTFSCPQPDHTFFDEQLNYRPEESMLFNPLGRYAQGGAPRSMETLTRAFEPRESRVSGSASLPSIGKCEEGTTLSQIQTNIDPNQFQLVRREDWSRASITGYGNDDDDDENDAISPASTDATSHGPYTPIALEGETGFPEAAMRRFSQELSTSCGSTGAEMFKGMDHMFDFPSTSREPAKQKQSSAAPPFAGFAHGSHSNTTHGGLPYAGRDTYGYSASGESTLQRYVNFRDANGLAINPHAAPPTGKQRGCTSTTATSEVQTQPDEEENSDTTPFTHRDKLLLDMREQGLTYKEIKRRGKFLAAESTLRGRVRQLTKHKSERVRKPHWTDNDVSVSSDESALMSDHN